MQAGMTTIRKIYSIIGPPTSNACWEAQKGRFMHYQFLFFFLVIFGIQAFGFAIHTQELYKKEKDVAFSFADVKYFHRFTTNDQHEYTPAAQEDLNAWKDMVTIRYYRKAKDDGALAAIANATLENYK